MVKMLTRHGNSLALVLDKPILELNPRQSLKNSSTCSRRSGGTGWPR